MLIINRISKSEAVSLLQNADLTEERRVLQKFKKFGKFIAMYKIGKGIIMFENIEIKKQKFHMHKSPISIGNVDINKTIASNKVPLG